MIRKSCAVFLLALILSICLSISAIAADRQEYKKPEDVVAWLYRDYAWEAMMIYRPFEVLVNQPKEVLEQYFSEELTSLILGDRKCHQESGMICRLDFSPLWDSQDPSADDLEILPANSANIVLVRFNPYGNPKKTEIRYKIEKSERGWRIKDIIYEHPDHSFSLLDILNRQE